MRSTNRPSLLARLHRDDRGAIGILLLLTIMAMVALIGMVWNAGAYSTTKQKVQAAADSAAQGASLWVARSENAVTATNQVMVENASAEVIWRATNDTVNAVVNRINSETSRVNQEIQRVEQQRQQNNQRKNPDPNREAELDIEEQVLQELVFMLNNEAQLVQNLVARTSPALSGYDPDNFAQFRGQLFDYQQQVIDQVTDTVDQQRASASSYYKCDIVLSMPSGDPVAAPIKTVDHTNFWGIEIGGVNVSSGNDTAWITGGHWGEILCPPLTRFFNDRVNRDINNSNTLLPLLQAIDQYRQQLGQWVQQVLTPNPNANQQTRQAYQQALNRINGMNLSQAFAVAAWNNALNHWRHDVLSGLGDGQLHVLATYGLYQVPDWAQSTVYNKAYNYVYPIIYNNNEPRLENQKRQQLLGQLGRNATGQQRAQAANQARAWAQQMARLGAQQIATMAANDWITIGWPYEITPPQVQVPPSQGITDDDRHKYFTVLAVSATTDATQVKPVMAKILKITASPMAAYAQGEWFNWMEYQGDYGGGERYDGLWPPAPWRLSTVGGWNWQPRLAFSDALGAALSNNQDMQNLFEKSGVPNADDATDIQTLVDH